MKTLKTKFKELGATYDQIGKAAGVKKQAVSNWVAAESLPSNAAIKICRHYDVTLDWLYDNEDKAKEEIEVFNDNDNLARKRELLCEKIESLNLSYQPDINLLNTLAVICLLHENNPSKNK